jgi:multidrug resistance efflux pump
VRSHTDRRAAWFLLARIPLYDTSAAARIEALEAMHPVDARKAGRAARVNLALGAPVAAGEVLVELEADAERLALEQSRARVAARPRGVWTRRASAIWRPTVITGFSE